MPTPTSRDGKDGQIRREPHRPAATDTLSRALTSCLPQQRPLGSTASKATPKHPVTSKPSRRGVNSDD